jgi:hypothetical protein
VLGRRTHNENSVEAESVRRQSGGSRCDELSCFVFAPSLCVAHILD